MDVDAALQSQIRNIETTYGHPLDHWFTVIDGSGLTKHNQVVALLKTDHGLAHGAAHRVSLLWRQRDQAAAPAAPTPAPEVAPADPVAALYTGPKARVRPLHELVIAAVDALGEYQVAPKKGYLSLRRRKQFAMLQPSSTGRLDLGLILPAGTPYTDRAEPAAGFNALFTHRIRITAPADVDDELTGLIATAFTHAG